LTSLRKEVEGSPGFILVELETTPSSPTESLMMHWQCLLIPRTRSKSLQTTSLSSQSVWPTWTEWSTYTLCSGRSLIYLKFVLMRRTHWATIEI